MKLFFVNILIIITGSAFGQGFNERHPEVRTFTESVDGKLQTYSQVILDNDEFMEQMTDGGGRLTGYFSGNEVRKINVTVGVSYGKYEFDYYFKNSKLYYIVESFKQYAYDVDTDTWNYSKMEQTFNGDYLFQPDFDYETLGHNRFKNDELDPEEVLKDEANGYLILLKNKKNAR